MLMQTFQVLQAFIEHEFKDLPGAAWVDRGRYLVMGLANNQALDEGNWSRSVVPGSTVMMSMVVQKLLDASALEVTRRCPESSCSGTWPRSNMLQVCTCGGIYIQSSCFPSDLDWQGSISLSFGKSRILCSLQGDQTAAPPGASDNRCSLEAHSTLLGSGTAR
jgi:hypothetical protein